MPGVTLYDPKTGAPSSMPAEAAQKAFEEGTHAPQQKQRIPVRLKDGRQGFVDGSELSSTLANGATIVDPEEEAHKAEVEAEKGPAGTVRAASLGLVTGAGLGPGVIRKGISAFSPAAGERFAHDVEVNREANPIVTPVSEAAGFAATVAATRGKGPVAPAAAIDAIGQIAERGAVRALGRVGGEGALAVAGRAAATHAARGAAEGALITAGAHVDEDMLGDHEVNGEKAFIAGLKGGLLTAAFGGALGGGASLVRSAAGRLVNRGATDLLHTAADELETKAETKAAEQSGRIEMPPSSLHNPEAYPSAPVANDVHPTEAHAFSSDMFSKVAAPAEGAVDKDLVKAGQLREVAQSGGLFHDLADEAAWRAGGGSKKLSAQAEQRAGGTKAVGQAVREAGILDGGTSHAELLERTEARLGQIGEEIGSTVGAAKVTVSAGQVLKSVDAAIAPLEKSAATQGDARAVQTLRADLYKTLGLVDAAGVPIEGALEKRIPFQDLIRERRALQGKVFGFGEANATEMKRTQGAITGAWNELEADALDSAAAGSGAEFRALNKQYQQLSLYKQALDKTIAAGHSNRRISLSDHIVGHASSMAGSAAAGPFGHVIGGVVGALTNKMLRERGNVVAAKVLGKIADLGAVRSYVQTVDKAVDGAARGLTTPREPRVGKMRTGDRPAGSGRSTLNSRYRSAIAELDELQGHPASVEERAMAHTQDLAAHAPKTAQSFTLTASRAAAFLAAKRPIPMSEPNMFSHQAPSILDTDKAEYLRFHEAAKDLGGVLKNPTPEGVEALKEITPEVYAQLQEKVMSEVAVRHAKGKPMPFRQAYRLGILFDIDTVPALDKGTFKQLQANVFTPPAPDQPKARGGKSNAPRRPTKDVLKTNPLSVFDNIASGKGVGRK